MVNTIKINGVTIQISNGDICISERGIFVDGNRIKVGKGEEVHITGDVGRIECTGNVTVTGNVRGSINAGGSVRCGDVGEEVDAGGSVTCKKVGGDVDAGGSVHVS